MNKKTNRCTKTHRWMNKHRWRNIHWVRVTNTPRWKNIQVNKNTCGPAAYVISEGGFGSRAESPQALHRIYKDRQTHTGGQIHMGGQAHTC